MSEVEIYKNTIMERSLKIFALVLSVLTAALAIIVWGNFYDWRLFGLTSYQFFPVFGLMAFSLLWSQYVVLATAKLFEVSTSSLKPFFNFSSVAILIAIVAHPSLLVIQLYSDGFGLPPGSYKAYVGPSLAWLTFLGSASLLVFLAFELRRFFKNKAPKFWSFLTYLCDLAMLAVFYHGLRLGDNLQAGWFRQVWIFYGIILIVSLIYLRVTPLFTKEKSS